MVLIVAQIITYTHSAVYTDSIFVSARKTNADVVRPCAKKAFQPEHVSPFVFLFNISPLLQIQLAIVVPFSYNNNILR